MATHIRTTINSIIHKACAIHGIDSLSLFGYLGVSADKSREHAAMILPYPDSLNKIDLAVFNSISDQLKNEFNIAECSIDRSIVIPLKLQSIIKESIDTSCTQQLSLSKYLKPQNIVVDYSSPNIAKPFHVGHLLSTLIGNTICNIAETMGNKVSRINYLGDWGTQYGLLSRGFDLYGNEAELRKNPLSHLLDVYVKANIRAKEDVSFYDESLRAFHDLEVGDPKITERWKLFRLISEQEFQKIYARLGIQFTALDSESAHAKTAQRLVEIFRESNLVVKNNEGVHGIIIKDEFVPLTRSDGSTLYILRDLTAFLQRQQLYHMDKAWYVVDVSQTRHFSQLESIIHLVQPNWKGQFEHVRFGKLRGLSTRKGQIVLLEELLDEAKARANRAIKSASTTRIDDSDYDNIAEILGRAAIFVNVLKSRRLRDAQFEWEQAFSMKGASGISLEYVHARLCSVIEKNSDLIPFTKEHTCEEKFLVGDREAVQLALQIFKYEEILALSAHLLEPCVLVQYLFKLARDTSKALEVLNVRNCESRNVAVARLKLFMAAKAVIAKGLTLLGVPPLEKM